MPEKRVATMQMSWFWDERGKRWTITWSYPSGRGFRKVDTSSPVGQTEAQLIADAVVAEMLSWLA